MFASRFQLEKLDLCRKDDLEAAFNMIAYLLNRELLPWYIDIRNGIACPEDQGIT